MIDYEQIREFKTAFVGGMRYRDVGRGGNELGEDGLFIPGMEYPTLLSPRVRTCVGISGQLPF